VEVAHRGASSTLSRMFKLAQECVDIKSKVAHARRADHLRELGRPMPTGHSECSSKRGTNGTAHRIDLIRKRESWKSSVKCRHMTDSEPVGDIKNLGTRS